MIAVDGNHNQPISFTDSISLDAYLNGYLQAIGARAGGGPGISFIIGTAAYQLENTRGAFFKYPGLKLGMS